MKVVILAGGFGTRISEISKVIPKPLVEIGGYPILWHVMKIYSHYGFNDFIICLGYGGNLIKEYFNKYLLYRCNMYFNFTNGKKIFLNRESLEPWNVMLLDTGLNTMTGGRLKRIKDYIGNETFMFTYSDGLADINIVNLLEFHKKTGSNVTVTAVKPTSRFGYLDLDGDGVERFREKSQEDERWINGGFFVAEPSIFDYIGGDDSVLEKEPLERLAADKKLAAYRHEGFWQQMDTIHERDYLEKLWNSGAPPWKLWQ